MSIANLSKDYCKSVKSLLQTCNASAANQPCTNDKHQPCTSDKHQPYTNSKHQPYISGAPAIHQRRTIMHLLRTCHAPAAPLPCTSCAPCIRHPGCYSRCSLMTFTQRAPMMNNTPATTIIVLW